MINKISTSFSEQYGNAIDFLMQKGNPSIQYRTLRELCEQHNLDEYAEKLIHSGRAKKILDCLHNHKEYHGATLYSVENSLNVLIDMGFRVGAGFGEFDQEVHSLATSVRSYEPDKSHLLHDLYCYLVTIPFLARAGMGDEWIHHFITERINIIHHFTSQGTYEIYDVPSRYGRIPESFQNRPIIKQALYEGGVIQFPLIYDLYGFAAVYPTLSSELRTKVNEIITYIMDDRFQTIEDGYGILRGKNRFYAMGWDPKPTNLKKDMKYNPLLQRMELLSVFDTGISSRWVCRSSETD